MFSLHPTWRKAKRYAMRSYIHFVLALLALCSDARAAKILGLFPHTGRSHQMVFEPLLQKLAERGHRVTVVSFFPLNNPPANYTDVSLQGISRLGVETIDLSFFENPNKLFRLLGIERIVKQIFEFHPLADMALSVCKKLVDWPPLTGALKNEYNVILMENFNSECMLGLTHIYGIKAPIVGLLSSNMLPWSAERIGVTDNPAYVPIVSTAFTDKMSFLERLENTLMKIYFKFWYRYAIQVKEQEILEKHFGRKIPDLGELSRNTSLMLVNTFHTLNGVKQKTPGLVEVGGMHLNDNNKTIPDYLERFLNESDHGVVLFSFGSLIKTATIPKYKEEIIVNVLSKLKQRVIWKYEDSAEEGTLTGNILRVKWIPQHELLHHRKVVAFIAHGGLLGMTEAVSAGKPMVVVPFFGDQPLNAAAAAAAGLARVVSYADLSEESFSEALNSVLSAELRLSARQTSKMWHDRESKPLDTAIYNIERLIRWGYQDPLHSSARDLTFIQYALLDVSAAIVLAVLVLILILRVLLSLIPRVLTAVFNNKEKKKVH